MSGDGSTVVIGDTQERSFAGVARVFRETPLSKTPTLGPTCTVPKVIGLTLAKATLALREQRCSVGRITRVKSRILAAGRVVGQSEKPGAQVLIAVKIALRVGRGKK